MVALRENAGRCGSGRAGAAAASGPALVPPCGIGQWGRAARVLAGSAPQVGFLLHAGPRLARHRGLRQFAGWCPVSPADGVSLLAGPSWVVSGFFDVWLVGCGEAPAACWAVPASCCCCPRPARLLAMAETDVIR